MTEHNEIEFMEPGEGRGTPASPQGGRGGSTLPARIGIVAGTALLVVLGAAVAMGASPTPPVTTPGASAAPGVSAAPGKTDTDNDGDHGFGMRGGDLGGGFRDITIASISGSSLSLKTDDGWNRTITADSTTTITKGGATITAGDLAVGDQVVFSQARQTDGTYTITAIRVILPTLAGQVTAVTDSTLAVTRRDGTTATIHVTASTTYRVQGVTTATLSDIKVGANVVAEGTLRADGSLDATSVGSGFRGGPGMGGHGRGHDGWDGTAPDASPSPSTTPG